jgi:hypothetical protein
MRLFADETKQLAEATYMKKSMYYNMRIRTLRRHASSAARIAADGKKVSPPARGAVGVVPTATPD